MANICPLLIHASIVGRTYHDFQLKFDSPSTNCTIEPRQNPLLIQFTRFFNSTFNDTLYLIHDATEIQNNLPNVQVFNNDRVNLCIRSALHSENTELTCHEFYMITMLSSINTSYWPLFLILAYIMILLIAMLFSLCAQLFDKLSQTFFSGSITKKLMKNRNLRSFLPLIQRHEQNHHLKKIDEKEEFLNSLDLIAKACQPTVNTFIIQTEHDKGHTNRAYL